MIPPVRASIPVYSMKRRMMSVRSRITLLTLVPLLLVAGIVGFWAFQNTRGRAESRFDESLLATATAIARDVLLSDGDALSLATRDLLQNTSGGRVYYHVYAPDGVFITGYATPPVAPRQLGEERQLRYSAVYHGSPVRVIRILERMQIDGLLGDFTITVWQQTSVRDAFIQDQARQTYGVIGVLTASVVLIVWIGVRIGLRPLLDLQDAIASRSSTDLTPIRRPVPAEVRGIVGTLNELLAQVSDSMQAKNDFISNAAHQLRNPLAGVMAMAEAVRSAPSTEAAMERTEDLHEAAKQASDVANKLLSFERANRTHRHASAERADLAELACSVIDRMRPRSGPVTIAFQAESGDCPIIGDLLMIREAITNLVDNALLHGGTALTQVAVHVSRDSQYAKVIVSDNGIGMTPEQQNTALERFGQVNPGRGAGLGLSIVQSVALAHQGSFQFHGANGQLSAVLQLPLSSPQSVEPHSSPTSADCIADSRATCA